MNTKKELALSEPYYSTYHMHGISSAVIESNNSMKNWYINNAFMLVCSRKFLSGFSSPLLDIEKASWLDNPYVEGYWYDLKFAKGYINYIIRDLIDNNFYVFFHGVDDYYINGKSWYHKRHFSHDGLICGYDQTTHEFCLHAYDSNWVYRKFWIPQSSFIKGLRSKIDQNGRICGIKSKHDQISFDTNKILNKMRDYVDSDLTKYPFDGDGNVYGSCVHSYIAKYIDFLADGTIPYEKIDWRIFRMIWEHKKRMYERIQLLEKELKWTSSLSDKYEPLIRISDQSRMLYASYVIKRRDSVLPEIKKQLIEIEKTEKYIIKKILTKAQKENLI